MDMSSSKTDDDSRAAIMALTDAVANLTQRMNDMQLVLSNITDARMPPPVDRCLTPEEFQCISDTTRSGRPNQRRDVIDTTWFTERKVEPRSEEFSQAVPNPWIQHVASTSQIEVFDGDPKKWPSFIANFRSLVHETVSSDAQRLAILNQLLSPKLRNGFSGLLANPLMYSEVLQRLHKLYGDPKVLARSNLNDLLSLPLLKSDRCGDLEIFFFKVNGPVSMMKLCGLTHDLRSSALLEHVISKLTPRMNERWVSFEATLNSVPTLETFVDWLQRVVAEKVLNSGSASTKSSASVPDRRGPAIRTTVMPVTRKRQCLVCGCLEHKLKACPKFNKMTVMERVAEVRKRGMCWRCLERGHRMRDCMSRLLCGHEGCMASHHRLLHGAPNLNDFQREVRTVTESAQADCLNCTDVGPATVTGRRHEIVCAVVPVIVRGQNKAVKTFALLDSGSEVSLISQRIANKANLAGLPHELRLRTVAGETSIQARRVNCSVSSYDGSTEMLLYQAVVVPNLHMGTRTLHLPAVKTQWSHLAEIRFPVATIAQVEVLIGMDAPLAHRYYDMKLPQNPNKGPVGVLTPFGWTVIGRLPEASLGPGQRTESSWIRRHAGFDDDKHSLERLIRLSLDVDPLAAAQTPGKVTPEERVALDILEATTKFNGERYEIGLLWKNSNVALPCNRDYALRRFFATERRLLKDPDMASRYIDIIEQYVRDGHARKVPLRESGTAERVWYLPHHAVWNTQRTKIRVVFDASARYLGVSLNDCLLKGPDYLPNLCGILMRFRMGRVAVSADIQCMYHQVLVRPEDKSALRFFWRHPGSECPPETFEMQVHVFGATSSPCVCMYAVRRAAADNQSEYPEVLQRIQRNMYVDNWLESFTSETVAKRACMELKQVLARSGFHLRKWASSKREVLSGTPPQDCSEIMMSLPPGCDSFRIHGYDYRRAHETRDVKSHC
uniref:CCHC-type domain-containing protein n=1 Tax=Trichuris muris TaxID=70415 RepID=A0A5S6QPA6_TRIMR